MCFHHLTRLELLRGLLLHVVQRTRIKDLEIFGTELDVRADLCVFETLAPLRKTDLCDVFDAPNPF
jgi:hypothetical protein